MSGQPSTNPSGPRPSANGVGAGGMTSSQQRIDPQTASSTSNGQSGSMSQSNLNSIVRRKVSMLSSVCITFVRNHCLPSLRKFCPRTTQRFHSDGSWWISGGKSPPFQINWKLLRSKTWRTKLLARCCCRAQHRHFMC